MGLDPQVELIDRRGEFVGSHVEFGQGQTTIGLRRRQAGNRVEIGDRVSVTATPERPVDVALLGGAPVEGPVLFSGPFVMDTPERLAQTKRDFASGKMGTLDGVPF